MFKNRMAVTSFEVGPFTLHLVREGIEQSKMRELLTHYWETECIPSKGRIESLYVTHWPAVYSDPPQAEIAVVSLPFLGQVAFYWCSEDPAHIYRYESLEKAALGLNEAHGYGSDVCSIPWTRQKKAWHEQYGGKAMVKVG